jgi:peptide chain release factor 3
VEDKEGNLVYLAESAWYLNTERTNNPEIKFYITSDFKHELE